MSQTQTDVPKGYNTPIPSRITTPDRVETSLGTLDFRDGVPSDDTADKLFHHLDLLGPDGYFVSRSRSYSNWIILRGFVVDGQPDTATRVFKDGLRIYPCHRPTARRRWSLPQPPG